MQHNNLTIVNQQQQFQKVSLMAPVASHYLHIAAEVDHSPFPFFIGASAKKKELIAKAKDYCIRLEKEEGIISAVVFKAVIIPPGRGRLVRERKGSVQVARYDVAILIEAASQDKITAIQSSKDYKELESAVRAASRVVHTITATNVKHIAPVDHKRQGVFLFNYFYADSLQQNLAVWEYTAGWFQQETGLDNSTVLLPDEPGRSQYAIINHCRWDKMSDILPSLIFKRSFRSYVLDNFYANNVAAMPVLYTLA